VCPILLNAKLPYSIPIRYYSYAITGEGDSQMKAMKVQEGDNLSKVTKFACGEDTDQNSSDMTPSLSESQTQVLPGSAM
jgi:hypothetical protein